MEINQDTTSQAPSLERILKVRDSLEKLPPDKQPRVSDIADRYNYNPSKVANSSSQSVDKKSSFDKGRFIEQDRKQYIVEQKSKFFGSTVLPISMGLVILVIVVYAFKDGLGKFLSKIR